MVNTIDTWDASIVAAVPETMAAAPDQRLEEFGALYRGHVRDVYRYSLSVVHDPAEAEDVTQSTFLNAYRAYTGPLGKPQAWLLTIARNICFERHRRMQRRPKFVPLHEAATTPADDPAGVRAGAIFDALQEIPARQRTALLLDAIDGRTRAEIAAELEIGETTVTGLLMRARGNLRLQLDEGMSCKLARELQPRLWGTELHDAKRRAAMAHLRNCERCAVEEPSRRSISGLLAALIPAMRSVWQPVVGALPGGTAGLGAAAAVVAAAGTLAWQVAPAAKGDGPSTTTPPAVEPAASNTTGPVGSTFAALPPDRGQLPAARTGSAAAPTSLSGAPLATRRAPDDAQSATGLTPATQESGDTARPAPSDFGVALTQTESPTGDALQSGGTLSRGTSAVESSQTTEHVAAPEHSMSETTKAMGADVAPAPTDTSDSSTAAGPTGTTGAGNGGTPPGQAKAATTPPGQARADQTPPGQTSADRTPPGQAKA